MSLAKIVKNEREDEKFSVVLKSTLEENLKMMYVGAEFHNHRNKKIDK